MSQGALPSLPQGEPNDIPDNWVELSKDGIGPVLTKSYIEVEGKQARLRAVARNESGLPITHAKWCIHATGKKGCAFTLWTTAVWAPGETIHWEILGPSVQGEPEHSVALVEISAAPAGPKPEVQVSHAQSPVQNKFTKDNVKLTSESNGNLVEVSAPSRTPAHVVPAGRSAASGTVASAVSPTRSGVANDYHIGAGDVLQIVAWKEPDVSVPSAVVRPDGKIAVPLLKELKVAGLTPTQLENLIGDRLSHYIQGVDVTVVVSQINSKKAYIVGAVKKEGPLPLLYPMSVLQGLSEAGGLTDYAKRNRIYVLRNENGSPTRLPFNYEAVIRGEQMDQNIQLRPDDTIVVPQ